jgi:hypothetical protein
MIIFWWLDFQTNGMKIIPVGQRVDKAGQIKTAWPADYANQGWL